MTRIGWGPGLDDIARAHGLKPASELPPPKRRPSGSASCRRQVSDPTPSAKPSPAAAPKPPTDTRKWPGDARQALRVLAPHALALVAAARPETYRAPAYGELEPVDLGGNRGCWPVRLVKTKAIKDTASPAYDNAPFGSYRVRWRLWLATELERDQLAEAVQAAVRAMPDEAGFFAASLNDGWADAGADFLPGQFLEQVRDIARDRLRLAAWDDAELYALCVKMGKDARKKIPHGDLDTRSGASVLNGLCASAIARELRR